MIAATRSASPRFYLPEALEKSFEATNEWGNFHLKQPFGLFEPGGRRLASTAEAFSLHGCPDDFDGCVDLLVK